RRPSPAGAAGPPARPVLRAAERTAARLPPVECADLPRLSTTTRPMTRRKSRSHTSRTPASKQDAAARHKAVFRKGFEGTFDVGALCNPSQLGWKINARPPPGPLPRGEGGAVPGFRLIRTH